MGTQRPIVVALVESNRVVREGFAQMMAKFSELLVIPFAVADDEQIDNVRPDVLVLDPPVRENASRVTAALKKRVPETRIVAVGIAPVVTDVIKLREAGVTGFVPLDATFDEFVATIRQVAAGATVVPHRLTEPPGAQADAYESPNEYLTERECEVIALIDAGLNNSQIARRLGISSHTVKSHVRHIMEKLELHTRLEIAACYHWYGHVPATRNAEDHDRRPHSRGARCCEHRGVGARDSGTQRQLISASA